MRESIIDVTEKCEICAAWWSNKREFSLLQNHESEYIFIVERDFQKTHCAFACTWTVSRRETRKRKIIDIARVCILYIPIYIYTYVRASQRRDQLSCVFPCDLVMLWRAVSSRVDYGYAAAIPQKRRLLIFPSMLSLALINISYN